MSRGSGRGEERERERQAALKAAQDAIRGEVEPGSTTADGTETEPRPDLPASSAPTKRTPAEIAAAPGVGDVLAALPKNANGGPDLEPLKQRMTELGVSAWNNLSPEQRSQVYQTFAQATQEADPFSVPLIPTAQRDGVAGLVQAMQGMSGADAISAVKQQIGLTVRPGATDAETLANVGRAVFETMAQRSQAAGSTARGAQYSAQAREVASALAGKAKPTGADTIAALNQPLQLTEAERTKFDEVLGSKLPRKDWAKATRIPEPAIKMLIDEAVKDGRLKMVRGQPRRTGQKAAQPAKTASPAAAVAPTQSGNDPGYEVPIIPTFQRDGAAALAKQLAPYGVEQIREMARVQGVRAKRSADDKASVIGAVIEAVKANRAGVAAAAGSAANPQPQQQQTPSPTNPQLLDAAKQSGRLEIVTVGDKPGVTNPVTTGTLGAVRPGQERAQQFREQLISTGFKTITEARSAAKAAGITETGKALDEYIETAIVDAARQMAASEKAPGATYNDLVRLYNRQPNLGVRTSTSFANQAYSTPMPLAYLASRLAGVSESNVVYEPTAGNGALLIEADPAKQTVYANEIEAGRAAALAAQGFRTSSVDGADPKQAARIRSAEAAGSVIMNPPFGAVRDKGKSKTFDVGGWSTTQIDHAIALQALNAMADDGKAVLILGGIKAESVEERRKGYRGQAKREFYARLYGQYNVTDHFTVSGDLYAKQGASWPVDVVVIDGRGKSKRTLPAASPPTIFDSWDALAEKLPDGEVRRPVDGQADGADPGVGQPDAGDAGGIEPASGSRSGELPAGSDDKPARVRGSRDRGQPASPRGLSSQPGVPEQPGSAGDAGTTDQPSAPRQQRVKRAPTGGQAQYEPASTAISLDTLIPVNMAGAAQAALRRVEERHGSVDALVADRLGYAPETLSNYFSAEQVDAIAAAIDNVERGAAFILGDQTGIGKGRVVAGMLRYAMRRQLVPVLVTEKPDLYGDMYRDLRDIGIEEMLGREPRMFMTNSGESVTLDETALEWKQEVETARAQGKKAPAKRGKFLTGPAGAKQLDDMRAIVSGEDRYDVVFTTYDQMNTVRGADTPRRQFLGQLGPRAMIAFDESHNAGGAAKTGWESKNKPVNRADFARDLAKNAAGVIFSSATYAKRPDVMDLYARTDMGKAVDDPKQLPDLIQRGGVPMQQIVATMLSDSGQYMRRERSFDGIEYAVEPVPVDADTYRQFSEAIRAVFKFDLAVKDVRKDLMEDLLDAKGMAQSKDSGVGEGAAHTTSFSSIMHNIVGQMLLAIKAKATAQRAIQAHSAGEKPIIALANTNESFIKDFAEQEGIAIGEALELDFGDVLRRYLGRTLRVTIKSAEGEKEHVHIPVADLPGDLQTAYADALAMIDSGIYDGLPISPIDAIRNALSLAGMSVAEVTGRQTMIDYSGETATYVGRPRKEQGPSGKRSSIAAFNAGRLDALILNRSGSTGVSMHASEKFKDQRKRRMILAQAEANIDTHLQMLGRVHRTGQVIPPAYSQVAAEIPAEARPTAVLMRKMASLNANTTGARGSVFMSESVDFMNEVGDKVVWEYLRENPEIEDALGGDILKVGDDGLPSWVDAAKRATGRLVLLPPEKQSEFLEAVQSEYKAALEELDALGENPLEAKTVDLQARTLEATELKPSTGDGPFLAASTIEKVSVKSSGRAMAMADVVAEVAKALDISVTTGEPTAVMASLIDKGREWATKSVASVEARTEQWLKSATADMEGEAKTKFEERERQALDRLTSTMQIVYPGSRVSVAMPAGELNGIVLSAERTGTAKSPTAGGSWTVTIAVPDSMRVLKLSMAKLFPPSTKMETTDKGARLFRSSLSFAEIAAELDKARLEGRETRYVVTGNILAGFDQVNGKGQIVNFTAEDGTLRPGILMGRDFRQDKFMSSRSVRFASGEHVAAFLDEAPNATVRSSEGNVIITQRYGEYKIETPASRATGGRYYTDPAVRDALGTNEFVKSGNRMFARPNRAQMIRAVDAIKAAGALLETTSNQDLVQKLAPKSGEAQTAASTPLPPSSLPSATEIVNQRKDRSYALGATGFSDGLEQEFAAKTVERGGRYNVPEDVAAGMRAAIKRLPGILPASFQPALLLGARLVGRNSVRVAFERADGTFSNINISLDAFKNARAITDPDSGSVILLGFDLPPNFENRLAVELWHEAIHALRIVGALKWSEQQFIDLARHAMSLRILEMSYREFKRALGDPQWEMYSPSSTIGETYLRAYSGRANLRQQMEEEAVAHMTELLVAGVPLPLPESIRRIYADIETGRMARGETVPPVNATVEPDGTDGLLYRIGDYLWRTSIDDLAGRLGAVPITKLRPWSKHRGPVLAFHGTAATTDFSTFDADEAMDIAQHFGTPDIANKFAAGETFRGDVSDLPGRVFPVVLDIRNPVTLPDLGEWGALDVVEELSKAGVVVTAELEQLANVVGNGSGGRRGFNRMLREHLTSLGYDGIRYLNAVEGKGFTWSYIAIAPGTVTSALHRDVMFAMGGRGIEQVWGPKWDILMGEQYRVAEAGSDYSTMYDILSAKLSKASGIEPDMRAAMLQKLRELYDDMGPEGRAAAGIKELPPHSAIDGPTFDLNTVRTREQTHALAVHFDAVPVAELGEQDEHPGRVVDQSTVISAERVITLAGPAPTDPAALREAITATGVEIPDLPTIEAIHQHLSSNGYSAIRHHDPATGWHYAVWEPANVIGTDVDAAAFRAEMKAQSERAAAMEAEDVLELSTPAGVVNRDGVLREMETENGSMMFALADWFKRTPENAQQPLDLLAYSKAENEIREALPNFGLPAEALDNVIAAFGTGAEKYQDITRAHPDAAAAIKAQYPRLIQRLYDSSKPLDGLVLPDGLSMNSASADRNGGMLEITSRDGTIVARAHYRTFESEAQINHLLVEPDFRKHGLAQLLEEAVKLVTRRPLIPDDVISNAEMARWVKRSQRIADNYYRIDDQFWQRRSGGMMFAFAGSKAKTANLAALSRAEKMEASGPKIGETGYDQHRTEIWNQTGWFRGTDQKWRFEIDDSSAAIRRGLKVGGQYEADEAVSNDGLFAAYPALRDLMVYPVKGRNASYSPTGAINLGMQTSDRTAVALHEMQHATQQIEGFARGGSPRQFGQDEIAAERARLQAIQDGMPPDNGWTSMDVSASVGEMTDEDIAFTRYSRLAGEVEARTVERRRTMTAAERLALPPWISQDTDDDMQLVRFRGDDANAERSVVDDGQAMFAMSPGKWQRSDASIASAIEKLKDATGMTVLQGLRGITLERGDGTARIIPGDGKNRGSTSDGRSRQRFGNTWLGARRIEAQYDNYSGVARMRSVRRLDETAHEAAHHLERIVGAPLLELQTQFGAELDGMAIPGLADTRSEQWAEWFRLYITNPDAARLAAPGLYEAFEDMLDGEMPGMLGKLESVQEMIANYNQQSPLDQVANDLVAARHRNVAQRAYGSYRDGTLAGDISVGLSNFYTGTIAKLNPIWKVTNALLAIADRNGVRDSAGKPISLKATEHPEKVFRSFAGSYKKGHNWMMKGIRDTDGSQVAPPLRDALIRVFGARSEERRVGKECRSRWSPYH
jgi:predicted GNAT family acetyltransferase